MMIANPTYKGYRDPALTRLKELGVSVWSDVVLKTARGAIGTGAIFPASRS